MTRNLLPNRALRRPLPGPTVQYSDGRIVTPRPLNVERILTNFEGLDTQERAAFLCIFAHDLTVEIRSALLDRPVHEADLDRVNRLNEYLHQLTSCVNPAKRWSVRDEVTLVRALVESSYQYGLQSAVGSALAKAARNAMAPKAYMLAKQNYSQVVAAYGEKIVEAELLRNGWLPANVNATVSNAANFDIFAQKSDHIVPIQVKTCGPDKKEFGLRFPPSREPGPNDFTVLVKMGRNRETDQIFVMPTRELHEDIKKYRQAYLSVERRDIGMWILRLEEPRRDVKDYRRPSYGFAQKWQRWLNNWKQLEATTGPTPDVGRNHIPCEPSATAELTTR
jgi:hypothetical protein